jgi:hypothetical protein
MTQKADAHAGDAGALKAGRLYEAHNTPNFRISQQAGRVRALLHALADAARVGSLAPWDCAFVASIARQAALGRWRPSPKQAAILHRIGADLANTNAPRIDDTETKFPALRRRCPPAA